ncbi:MAG: hypothetical protein RL722_886 [Pseudomonadota bacterium]|jgi:NAD-dependent deacetylase
MDEASLDKIAALLRGAHHVAVSTGAGISAESGIPTFRDALTGLWAHFDPETLATPEAFVRDPALVWGWYEWRRHALLKAQPNPGHLALAALAHKVRRLSLITQNIDDLHERAGSQEVIHLHGSMFAPRCFDCGAPFHAPAHAGPEPAPLPDAEGGERLDPPLCRDCGGLVRPGVVWFNEMLPAAAWRSAERAALGCDVFLSIGTSAQVYPAAGLPDLALERGVLVVVINPDLDGQLGPGRVGLQGKAGEILPRLVERV